MNEANRAPHFFSAYPLKSIPTESKRNPNLTPYLEALLASQTRVSGKARVFPMVNPYPDGLPVSQDGIRLRRQEPTRVDGAGKEWFGGYE